MILGYRTERISEPIYVSKCIRTVSLLLGRYTVGYVTWIFKIVNIALSELGLLRTEARPIQF